MEEDGMRARSFRDEDYNTRRVFLRSYPLHWDPQSEADESFDRAKVANITNGRKTVDKIILVFGRVKSKITIFVVSCVPVSFKAPTALISVV
ncbi:hypothetical protein CASFOL_005948 [Castilleja foliolosa]|uniref:Uncharacterized protein n=1 Tax=Castilleja foliolosa TaxID=1961234 RepID=A0ABD3E4Y9_9LAMI